MTDARRATSLIGRIAYPAALIPFVILAIVATATGLSLVDPASTGLAVVMAIVMAAGTIATVLERDAHTYLATLAETALLGPLLGSLFAGDRMRFQLLGLLLTCSLFVLLVGPSIVRVRNPFRNRFARTARVIVIVLASVAFLGGLVTSGFAALSHAVDAVGLNVTTYERLPAPGGQWILVTEHDDQGAIGDSTSYSLEQSVGPFLRRRVAVPFDDGFYHEVSWTDALHLSVDGLPWTVGGPAPAAPTTRRGITWKSQATGTQNTLSDVHFTDTQTGYATGEFGTAIKTGDGGRSWRLLNVGTNESLYSNWFTDARNGWIVTSDGSILHTADGGSSWTKTPSGSKGQLFAVRFIDQMNGWIVGEDGWVLHTLDGGRTWARQSLGTKQEFTSIDFVDSRNGWIGGDSGVFHTSDGGRTWKRQSIGQDASIQAICFIDAERGWAAGYGGRLLKTTDGGKSWVPQPSGTGGSIEDLYFRDAKTGWAVGSPERDGMPAVLLMTSDGGASWTAEPADKTDALYKIAFPSPDDGVAVGDWGAMLHTASTGH